MDAEEFYGTLRESDAAIFHDAAYVSMAEELVSWPAVLRSGCDDAPPLCLRGLSEACSRWIHVDE